MPVVRLALAVILFCTLSAFAQQRPHGDIPSGNLFSVPNEFAAWTSDDAPAGPWRIMPQQSEQADSTQSAQEQLSNSETHKRVLDALNALERMLADRHIDPNSVHPWVKVSPDGVLTSGVDEDCYAIRSYVVARDSKDSDATHRVSESTCQPASQYAVKSTVLKSGSSNR
jgi:hypothetical protein